MSTGEISAALVECLLSDASIAAVVQNRVHVIQAPQGSTKPHIILNQVSESQDYHLEGESGPAGDRYQIDVWSKEVSVTKALALLVRERLSGFHGRIDYGSSSPQKYVIIKGVFVQTGFDGYDAEAKLFRNRRDYNVWHTYG